MTRKTGTLWKKAAGCLLALTLMSACSAASAASSSSTTAESADISTKYAEVQSIDGSSVTVAYGTIQEKSADSQNSGAQPSGAPDASAMPDGSAAPDMTSGATATTDTTTGATSSADPAGGAGADNGQAPGGKGQQGQAPDGSAPQGGQQNGAMPSMSAADLLGFTASGDTATVTVDSDVTIIKDSQTVSVSDIAAGDILMITCTGDKVTAIEIMSAQMPQNGQPGVEASSAPAAEATASA